MASQLENKSSRFAEAVRLADADFGKNSAKIKHKFECWTKSKLPDIPMSLKKRAGGGGRREALLEGSLNLLCQENVQFDEQEFPALSPEVQQKKKPGRPKKQLYEPSVPNHTLQPALFLKTKKMAKQML